MSVKTDRIVRTRNFDSVYTIRELIDPDTCAKLDGTFSMKSRKRSINK